MDGIIINCSSFAVIIIIVIASEYSYVRKGKKENLGFYNLTVVVGAFSILGYSIGNESFSRKDVGWSCLIFCFMYAICDTVLFFIDKKADK